MDPAAVALIDRCARAVEGTTPAPQAVMFSAAARQRLMLVNVTQQLRAAEASTEARIAKARGALRGLARTDKEKAQIAIALLDLDDGHDPSSSLPKRIVTNDAYRDLIEAHGVLQITRAEHAKISAQIDAIDKVFAEMPAPVPPSERW